MEQTHFNTTRSTSALRRIYESEVRQFKEQHGGLEKLREKLGLSRRKMCQLLLVDPSAWSRWMRDESRVPPHIYRSLEWYLALNHRRYTDPDLSRLITARYQTNEVEKDSQKMISEIHRLKSRVFYLQIALFLGVGVCLSLILLRA